MQHATIVKTGLLIGCLLGGWALAQQTTALPTITLAQSVHFFAPDETDVEAQAGIYQVESAGEMRLRLSPPGGGMPLLIQAQPTTHVEAVESPVAMTVLLNEDTQHVLLLMPDHTVLDAPGSLSGVRSRGKDFSRALTALQISQAAQTQQQTLVVGGPAPPIPVNPQPGAIITGPPIRFQWQLGAGPQANARYEICVTELNQSCSVPTAVVVKVPAGVALTEPVQPKQSVPFGPKPGDPNFERPMGSTGQPSYGYGVTLPLQFQGKRLQWSITVCVPSTAQIAFIGQPPESCAASAFRAITWALPVPMLSSPMDNVVLPVAIRQGFEIYPANHSDTLSLWYHQLTQPSFVWTYPNQQGIDYFLVCLAKANVPCPTQPTVQSQVVVTLVRGALGFTLTQDLTPFMGQTLNWTVAACNAAVGCVYQQQPRRLRIPLLIGSFLSIYEVTQNPKCKNCHEMFREDATYLRHIQLGRFTRQEVPSSQLANPTMDTTSLRQKCQTCHTAATGFVDFWRAPDAQLTFEKPLSSGFCVDLKFEPGTSAGGVGHLRDDPFVVWGVDHIPGLGRTLWQQTVDTWVNRGAPCPCDGTKGQKCDLFGQFTP